ncbi:HAMP domain-containing histidine kinase [Cellulomonas sp. zg-Y338]|uniref:Sensor histidine kinase MtrB n=1 Tax=Cellulomonas chengniuliangii TaxID=2968084 RepID=A0ABY5KYE6_9CELL|nr:MtrAB system histidine kinase MtrB [Cellulomonas chengniuliangii]MCC2308781.1 HAMP domain-containing histidine kinase [Cellulomonas chengniuliangii]MCC2316895.1 HAMP domain-containing histidine kinase [Cellulomonas chengniuliangii]UUI74471.1 MtrAB system histidine kinase MtrB [Cellulomonas chengniuliangii]
MRRAWRLTRSRAISTGRALSLAWRSSLQVRVVTTTLAIGLVALALVGSTLTQQMRDGLFTERVDLVLDESARATLQAQETFDASMATSITEVQQQLNDVVRALRSGGSGDREVLLTRAPGQATLVNSAMSNPGLFELVSDDLRRATAEGSGQRWQSVEWVGSGAYGVDQRPAPAVMVGQTVSVPIAGTFELYFLYSLQAEQERLDFLQRTLAIGAAALVVLLGTMTWMVTRQVVRPVRAAAKIAERIADGHLDDRMPVRGVDELATLGRSFNEMAHSLQEQISRMEELSTLQRRFVSDVSHELRTPLTTIRMAGEVLHGARDDFEPSIKRSAELLQTQLDRFEDLLADLLEISRFDAGAAILDAEDRDVREVVGAAADHAFPLAEHRGVWLSVHLPDTRCAADIDPRRVERILRNLLDNAIEHADGSIVDVTLAADATAIAVTVRDHGVGMTQEAAARVFDRFWRADPARARTTGGTGLGLAISLEDAHLHGGWLEAWGKPGAGACFRLTLPRRAGIRLQGSPLPLVPAEEPAPPAPAQYRFLDPAALPELDDELDHQEVR